MKSVIVEELKNEVKNWWVSLLVGILFVGMALLLMFYPLDGYATLSIMFSINMFVCGMFEILFSVSNKDNLSGWGWYLIGGIIDLLMGLYLMYYPEMSMAILPFIVAFWFMFRGFSMIGFSMDLQRYGSKGWGWILVSGILIILCSLTIIWFPAGGAFSVVYIAAFAFLSMGMTRIMISFDLKKLKDDNNKLLELTHQTK
ncbi:HdeD family acid-resistance protein [Flavobacterium branchiicola]|uniref:HdeD family acid-resistance protein n=1 Tax=Flavobacterium branchiicola TaxID=1114875 RepID=A0ABV9P6E2_9FLAO|nr:DUF308 domain-containing protein [Flavobacterium branchiicola]MBS7253005.1 DUF308 domain-containing protein [Flavobacterium branchiicola]